MEIYNEGKAQGKEYVDAIRDRTFHKCKKGVLYPYAIYLQVDYDSKPYITIDNIAYVYGFVK